MAEENNKIEDIEVQSANVESLDKVQDWFNANGKKFYIVIGSVLALFVAVGLYYNFVILKNKEQVVEKIYGGQIEMMRDSFNLALNGGENVSLSSLSKKYGNVSEGNMATIAAGLSALQLNDYGTAIKYLEDASLEDEYLAPYVLIALGDAYAESQKVEGAIKSYTKAGKYTENKAAAALGLKKAGLVQLRKQDYEGAKASFQKIKENFPNTQEYQEAIKYLALIAQK